MRADTMQVLALLADWTSTGDLARLTGRPRQNLASLLRRLEAAGYVESRGEGGKVQAAARYWRATGKAPQGTTQADRVRAAVTREWRTTAEIMAQADATRVVAQVVLNRMADRGQVQKRIQGAGQARRALWRLTP